MLRIVIILTAIFILYLLTLLFQQFVGYSIPGRIIFPQYLCTTDSDCTTVVKNPYICKVKVANKNYISIVQQESCSIELCLPPLCQPKKFTSCLDHECVVRSTDYSKSSPESCKLIIDKRERSLCFRVLATSKNDPATCLGLENRENIESCLFESMERSGNVQFCTAIRDIKSQSSCYKHFAESITKKPEDCLQAKDEEIRSECIVELVQMYSSTNANLCNYATYAEDEFFNTHDQCLDDIGKRTENISLCTNSPLGGNLCKASILKDNSYCDKIPPFFEGTREDCLKATKKKAATSGVK